MRAARVPGLLDNPVETLESQLRQSLRPVNPDPKFVDHLHTRLKTPSHTMLEQRQNTAAGFLLVAFSLLTGIIFLWLVRQIRKTASLS